MAETKIEGAQPALMKRLLTTKSERQVRVEGFKGTCGLLQVGGHFVWVEWQKNLYCVPRTEVEL